LLLLLASPTKWTLNAKQEGNSIDTTDYGLEIQNLPVITNVRIGVEGTLESRTSGDVCRFKHRTSHTLVEIE